MAIEMFSTPTSCDIYLLFVIFAIVFVSYTFTVHMIIIIFTSRD